MNHPTAPAAELPPLLEWGPWLEQHPLAHFVYDPTSLRMLAANTVALQRYGYPRDELLSLTRADLLEPSELPGLRDFVATLPGSAITLRDRVWLELTREGRVLHASVRGMPVRFEGRDARLVAVVDAGTQARLAADAELARDLLVKAGSMAQLGGWSLDLVAQRAHWSDVVCALHELPPGSECDLDRAIEFYPDDAGVALRAAVEQCAAAGIAFDLELPFVGARGTERWVRVVGAAVRDGAGRVVRVEGALQDITARRRAAMALEQTRQRHAALLAAIPDLWMVLDADGRYTEVSDPHHPGLSSAWADKLGQRLIDSLGPALALPIKRLMDEAHRTGVPQSHRYELTVRSGAHRSFEARYVALDSGRTMQLIRDVTDMVLLEQRFRAMAEAAPIAIYMADTAGGRTYTNPAWQRLYGMTLEESLGAGWASAVHPDDRKRVQDTWLAHGQAAEPFELEFRVDRGDGQTRRVAASARPILRADGAVLGHVGTVVDLTQARELEAARQAQAVAEEAGRRQSTFMSRVSHELRTPLNAILGFGELLQLNGALADARAQTHVGHVVQAGRHMLALVDDLLELQRLEQGSLQPRINRIDAAPLLESCADMLRPAALAAGVRVEVDVPAAMVLHSDERLLRQILLNLGSNAVKYAGRDTCVVLGARPQGMGTEVTVSDNGRGMTALQLQRLFSPFERLGQETSGLPGSGLGLVITRQIARLLGGEVELASAPGQGTVATLHLPPV